MFQAITTPDRTVWAAANGGETIRSLDGGQTFERCARQEVELRSIGAFSALEAFAVSTDTTVRHTVDGGKSWQHLSIPDSIVPMSIHCSSDRELWLGADKGRLYQQIDGTQEWHLIQLESSEPVLRISSFGQRIACGTGGVVWSWTVFEADLIRRTIPEAYQIWDLMLDGNGDAWLSTFYRSYKLTLPEGIVSGPLPRGPAYSVASSDGKVVMLVAGSHLYVSYDGGVTVDTAIDTASNGVILWLGERNWLLFTQGSVHRSTDDGVTWTTPVSRQYFDKLFLPDRQTIIGLHRASALLHSTDRGDSWRKVSVPGIEDPMHVEIAADGAWYASNRSRLSRSTDSGANWEVVFTPSSYEYVMNVAVPGGMDTVYVNYANSYTAWLRSFNGGKTWDTIGIPSGHFVNFMSGGRIVQLTYKDSDSFDSILYSADAGSTWKEIPSPSALVQSMWAFALDDIWIWTKAPSLYQRSLYHTTDLGRSWTQIDSGSNSSINDVRRISAGNYVMLRNHFQSSPYSDTQYFETTSDGGNTWIKARVPFRGFSRLYVGLDDYFYLSGYSGLIRTRSDGTTSVEEKDVEPENMPETSMTGRLNVYSILGQHYRELNAPRPDVNLHHYLGLHLPVGLWLVVYTNEAGRQCVLKYAK